MLLRNPLSKFQADSIYKPLDDMLRRDMKDNDVEYLIVGNTVTDRSVRLEYTLELPIGNRSLTGVIVLNSDTVNVDLDNHYSFTEPELEDITWDADIDGTDIRLIISTNGLGENPVLIYRLTVLPVA